MKTSLFASGLARRGRAELAQPVEPDVKTQTVLSVYQENTAKEGGSLLGLVVKGVALTVGLIVLLAPFIGG